MSQQLGYLWAAVAVVWLGTLLYVASLVRRQERLRRQIEQLRRTLEDFR
jgi:CcmD family protein